MLHISNLSMGSCYLGVHGFNVQLYKQTDVVL